MFFVHEIHALEPAGARDFEAYLRDQWTPAVAAEPGTRVVWCARSIPGAVSAPELVTMTGVADGATLTRFGERLRSGDLRELANSAPAGRVDRTVRILAPLKFNDYAPDLASVPLISDGTSNSLYIHDFVPPRIGMQRPYEDAMEKVYLSMMEMEFIAFVMWGGFETVAGGGPNPENVMVTLIREPQGGTDLLYNENARDDVKPGTWLYDALKLRDTWTSRLLRTVPWSPTS